LNPSILNKNGGIYRRRTRCEQIRERKRGMWVLYSARNDVGRRRKETISFEGKGTKHIRLG